MSRNIPEYNHLVRWTVNDVCQWLMENRFGAFVSAFREAGIDGNRFAVLDDSDLSKMKCPMSKRSELIKCIKSIKKSAPQVQTFATRPPPSIPQPDSKKQNGRVSPVEDEGSGPDDDYGWASDFEEEDDHFDSGHHSKSKQSSKHAGVEPEDDYENFQGDNDFSSQGHLQIARNTTGQTSVVDGLRLALQRRAEKTTDRQSSDSDSDHPDYEEPDNPLPQRPTRSSAPPPPKGGGRPPPPVGRKEVQPPRPVNRREKLPLPPQEDEQPDYVETDNPAFEQLEYEVPDTPPQKPRHLSKPVIPKTNSPRLPGKRPPIPVPQPQEEEQPVYEDPEDETPPAVPAPRPNSRPGPRKPPPLPQPAEPEEIYEVPEEEVPSPVATIPPRGPPKQGHRKVPPPPIDDGPQELYEDPDSEVVTSIASRIQQMDKRLPPLPKGKAPPPLISRMESQPDMPAPPPPRNQKPRASPKAPVPSKLKAKQKEDDYEDDDDDDDLDQDDYIEPNEKAIPPPHNPPHGRKPAPPKLDDLPAYMDMQDREDDSQQDYEIPDPDFQHTAPPPRTKPKKEVPLPSPKQADVKVKDKKPTGGVAILPRMPVNAVSEDKNDGPPVLPSSRGKGHKGANEGRALPPPPSGFSSTSDSNLNHSNSSTVNSLSGKRRGSIPSRPLPVPPNPQAEESMDDKPWFHDLDRQTADRELKTRGKNGTYLVRKSAKAEQPYTLVIYNEHKVYNLPIRKKGNNFALGKFKSDEQEFDKVQDLVDFFKTHTLILAASGSGQTRLKETLPK